MEKILVTGGAGYLGSVLVRQLLRCGYSVTVLDNLLYGQPSLLHCCNHDNFTFVQGDARNEHLMQELLKKNEIIFPLAAIVGMKACDRDPLMARSVNLEAIRLLNRLRKPGQRVIFPCTNSGYGTRSGDLHCTEEMPLEPISLYGETKVKAEQELLNSPNTISLRLATVFGVSARMRLDLLVNDFVYRAAKEGELVIYEKNFKRNYVHIEDIAECFCFCIEHFDKMKNEVYNVGLNNANLSKQELAEKIKKHIPSLSISYSEIDSDPDKRNYIVSNEKINRKGFTARRSLDQGIRELLEAYRVLAPGNYSNA